ncbi:MAG: GNAT family N-acetyltransferase [Synergistaceae bacterium]|jgi:ribosomal protein S18 acetylase RimI-like enzyme|nr:GNAT family N-acetyltransferase [Synergistaceae bacterium]
MTEDVKVRPMELSDYDEAYALWKRTEGMGLRSLDDTREGIERFLRRNPSTCFVAVGEAGEGVIGVFLCGHDGRRGYVYHAVVAATRRGRGIGRALLSNALAALEKEGIKKAALVVFAANDRGNAFWEKTGFTTRPDLVYRNRSLDPRNV